MNEGGRNLAVPLYLEREVRISLARTGGPGGGAARGYRERQGVKDLAPFLHGSPPGVPALLLGISFPFEEPPSGQAGGAPPERTLSPEGG